MAGIFELSIGRGEPHTDISVPMRVHRAAAHGIIKA
jgi:hypothetical protein